MVFPVQHFQLDLCTIGSNGGLQSIEYVNHCAVLLGDDAVLHYFHERIELLVSPRFAESTDQHRIIFVYDTGTDFRVLGYMIFQLDGSMYFWCKPTTKMPDSYRYHTLFVVRFTCSYSFRLFVAMHNISSTNSPLVNMIPIKFSNNAMLVPRNVCVGWNKHTRRFELYNNAVGAAQDVYAAYDACHISDLRDNYRHNYDIQRKKFCRYYYFFFFLFYIFSLFILCVFIDIIFFLLELLVQLDHEFELALQLNEWALPLRFNFLDYPMVERVRTVFDSFRTGIVPSFICLSVLGSSLLNFYDYFLISFFSTS